MQHRFAQIITYITEPPIVLVLGVMILIMGKPPSEALAAFVFLLCGLSFPLIIFAKDYLTESDSSLDPSRKERNDMFLAGAFGFSLASILFGSVLLQSSFWFFMSMLLAVFMSLLYLVNLYFDKASIHIATFTLTVVILTVQVNYAIALALVALPLLIWTRITLHKHTWVQIMWGLAIGLAVGLLAWAI
jgi:hypothetical protein